MSDPIFVRGPHYYQTYDDYWRLVTLAGFPVVALGEMEPDNPERTYILTPLNGETQPGCPWAQARIILWDLEWHTPYTPPPGVSEVWASDAWYARYIGARFVPLGSHRDLVKGCNDPYNVRWDVCLLAYQTGRRVEIKHQLMQYGLSIAPNAWGEERDDILRHSRVMVHVHQHGEFPCVAAQRFALAASAHVPLISEVCADPAPFRPSVEFISAPFDTLAETTTFWVNRQARHTLAIAMFERMCIEHEFSKTVRKALQCES